MTSELVTDAEELRNVYVPAVELLAGSKTNGVLIVSVTFEPLVAPAWNPEIAISPPFERSKLPLALPIV